MKKIVPITGLAVMLVTVILYFTILGNSLLTVKKFYFSKCNGARSAA